MPNEQMRQREDDEGDSDQSDRGQAKLAALKKDGYPDDWGNAKVARGGNTSALIEMLEPPPPSGR